MARRRFGIFGRGPREGDSELGPEPPSDGGEGGTEPVAEADEPAAEAPSGDQSGRTCRAPQDRSSADVRQTASPPIAGIANVRMLRPKALRPGRAR